MTPTAASVIVGVGGGIAAYKACELVRLFTESGHRVRVVPTAAALRFVGEPTWAALSGAPVTCDVWTEAHGVPHVALGRQADLVVIAPATADLLGQAAHGLAGDLLTNVLLTARCPVVFAPAMHTEMWEHPATVANVAILRSRGAIVIEPAVGRLTGADTGKGRLPEPAEIFALARAALDHAPTPTDLAGRRVLITAGGTREPLDPVRFLGNRSSGKQGYAFARSALARGAEVTVIAANVALPDPAGARVIRVETTQQLRSATVDAARDVDVIVMAAAPSDFRPMRYHPSKIKKSPDGSTPALELMANPDIAAELGATKNPGQVLVVFAAETDNALAYGRAKLAAKRADLIVVNEVGAGRGFGTDDNEATVLGADGSATALPRMPKARLASAVLDLTIPLLGRH